MDFPEPLGPTSTTRQGDGSRRAGLSGSRSATGGRGYRRLRSRPVSTTTDPTARRRSWWGWGYEDEAVTAEQQRSLAAAVARRLGQDDIAIRPPARLEDLSLPAPRVTPPASLAGICSVDLEDRAGHTYGKSFRDVVRALRGQLDHPPDVVAFPTRRARRRRPPRLVHRRRRRGHPLRRRLLGGGRRRARGRPRLPRRRLDRPRPARPGAGDRPDLASGSHPGRRARAGARGPAAPARAHAAPLPPELRGLDARRLAGHPLRRPLRHRVHPHRRPRGVDAGRHAGRHQRELPPAGLRRRPVARPAVPGLRGHARHHHRGVDAAAGPPSVQGLGRASASTTSSPGRRRCGRCRSRACSPRTAACSTAARPPPPPASTTGGRSWCSASSRPTTPSSRGWRERWSWCADHGGEVPEARHGAPRRRRDPVATGRRVATVVPAGALHARRAGGHVAGARDLRDGDHLGPLPGAARRGDGGGAGRPPARLRRRAR